MIQLFTFKNKSSKSKKKFKQLDQKNCYQSEKKKLVTFRKLILKILTSISDNASLITKDWMLL